MNAILALSCYHSLLRESRHESQESDQRPALQYYYQVLHYIQKAMQFPSYRNSLELMATTIIISTYEMLHGASNDWQRHLQGVFWILRSRQIEVEEASLESTTWWAWLQQDVWAAFRERRRTYSTWQPKKLCSELNSYDLAARALWILAQVVNFCANDHDSQADNRFRERLGWADQLQHLLQEWKSCLTVEFSPLPSLGLEKSKAFEPRLIHPQAYGNSPLSPYRYVGYTNTCYSLGHAGPPCVSNTPLRQQALPGRARRVLSTTSINPRKCRGRLRNWSHSHRRRAEYTGIPMRVYR